MARPDQLQLIATGDLPLDLQQKLPNEVDGIEAYNRTWCFDKGHAHPIGVEIIAPCRKCEACLKRRSILWAHKAQDEIRAASRTWFATFTATPEQHYRWLCEARLNRLESCSPFDGETDEIEFRELVAAAGPDITRYVKRVRKATGSRFRYLIVAERHLGGGAHHGLPHWHALIHEAPGAKPIRKAVLKGQWQLGFSAFKLVENPAAAWYLCKYLSKDSATRIRASLRYGVDTPLGLAAESGVKKLTTSLLRNGARTPGPAPVASSIPAKGDIHTEPSA